MIKWLVILLPWVTVIKDRILHQLIILSIDALDILSWRMWCVVKCWYMHSMLLSFIDRFTSTARASFVTLDDLVSSHYQIHLICFWFIGLETRSGFTFHVYTFFFVTNHHRFWEILITWLPHVGMTSPRQIMVLAWSCPISRNIRIVCSWIIVLKIWHLTRKVIYLIKYFVGEVINSPLSILSNRVSVILCA